MLILLVVSHQIQLLLEVENWRITSGRLLVYCRIYLLSDVVIIMISYHVLLFLSTTSIHNHSCQRLRLYLLLRLLTTTRSRRHVVASYIFG